MSSDNMLDIMLIDSFILEQIEWDASVRNFQLRTDESIGELWVAFPPDYENLRTAPFHFMEAGYEKLYNEKLTTCRIAKLPKKHFFQEGDNYFFRTSWQRIRTDIGLTYYALYLPEYAIPNSIIVSDTRDMTIEFQKNVFRDDDKKRFVVYLECTSELNEFSFNIKTEFYFDKTDFSNSNYHDDTTVDFYSHIEHWKNFLSEKEVKAIEKYFITNNHYNMGDQYNVNQAGSVGPNSSATGTVFNNLNSSLSNETDYSELAKELAVLRQELLSKATLPEHYNAIGEVAKAEEAAKAKDGNKVLQALKKGGSWVLNIAKDLGTKVLVEIIKTHIPI